MQQMQDSKTMTSQALNTLGSSLNDYVKMMENQGHKTAAQVLAGACQQSSDSIQSELNRLYKVEAELGKAREEIAVFVAAEEAKGQDKEPAKSNGKDKDKKHVGTQTN